MIYNLADLIMHSLETGCKNMLNEVQHLLNVCTIVNA